MMQRIFIVFWLAFGMAFGLTQWTGAPPARGEDTGSGIQTGTESQRPTGGRPGGRPGVAPKKKDPGPTENQAPSSSSFEIGPESDPAEPRSGKEAPVAPKTSVPPGAEPQKKAEPAKAPPRPEPPKEPGHIVFNFDDADLYEVIRTVAEILNMSYIVEPGVGGKVTIHTAGKLRKEELFPVFQQILEVNGVAAIQEGDLYRIIKRVDAPRLPVSIRLAEDEKDIPPSQRIIIQIVPLRHISAQEMTKLLTPFLSREGAAIAYDPTNTLLIVDKMEVITKTLRLVSVFDVDLFQRVNHRLYPLKYLDAEEAGQVIAEILSSYSGDGQMELKFIAVTKLNTLIAVSQRPQVFEKIEQLIRELDKPGEDADPRIYIYAVKNGEAAQLGDLLGAVFMGQSQYGASSRTGRGTSQTGGWGGTGRSSKDSGTGKTTGKSSSKSGTGSSGTSSGYSKGKIDKTKSRNPLLKGSSETSKSKEQGKGDQAPARAQRGAEETVTTTGDEGGGGGTGLLKGEINVTVDEVRNTLIIEATPRDYRIVERVLDRLDVLPRQVLIEVMIAEISLDAKNELGVEWSYAKDVGVGNGLLSATIGTKEYAGLSLAVGIGNQVKASLTALATDNKVNILSSPMILASDNTEATIDVSTEIPIASAEISYASSGATPVTETNIQYRDTGVMLNVIPHINERGLVTMNISQEVSEQTEQDVEVGGVKYPAFFKRAIDTTLTVRHGQTIVIGGLIRENRGSGASGVPGLIDIPILRWIFGKQTETISKNELIMLITPYVIATIEDVDSVTQEFKIKLGDVMLKSM